MKKDISNRNDIELIITEFYKKLIADHSINHFFEHILQENALKEHLHLIVDFWEDILFGSLKYDKNALKPHLELHKKLPFQKEHFNTWLTHFTETIDYYFNGEKCTIAKQRAQSIATIMQLKMTR